MSSDMKCLLYKMQGSFDNVGSSMFWSNVNVEFSEQSSKNLYDAYFYVNQTGSRWVPSGPVDDKASRALERHEIFALDSVCFECFLEPKTSARVLKVYSVMQDGTELCLVCLKSSFGRHNNEEFMDFYHRLKKLGAVFKSHGPSVREMDMCIVAEANSTIYRAPSVGGGNEMCFKVAAFGSEAENQVRNEFRILQGLQHPNIITAHDIHHMGKSIVMRLDSKDMDLKTYIESVDWVSPWGGRTHLYTFDAIRLCIGMSRGIEYMHKNEIVHRDIKPANVFVTGLPGAFHPFIADMGLAHHERSERKKSRWGTLGFQAPEVFWSTWPEDAHGCELSGYLTDMFSFGMTVLNLFIGRNPLMGLSEKESRALMRIYDFSRTNFFNLIRDSGINEQHDLRYHNIWNSRVLLDTSTSSLVAPSTVKLSVSNESLQLFGKISLIISLMTSLVQKERCLCDTCIYHFSEVHEFALEHLIKGKM